MTPTIMHLLGEFWSMVRRIKQYILENGHRPCPLDAIERWDKEFENRYNAIHPFLACISTPQLYYAVSSLSAFRGPFTADNAHQAMMFQLNPPETMFGDPSLLDSDEVVRIQELAEAEAKQLASMAGPAHTKSFERQGR